VKSLAAWFAVASAPERRQQGHDQEPGKRLPKGRDEAHHPPPGRVGEVIAVRRGKRSQRALKPRIQVGPSEKQKRRIRFQLEQRRAGLPLLEERAQGGLMLVEIEPGEQGLERPIWSKELGRVGAKDSDLEGAPPFPKRCEPLGEPLDLRQAEYRPRKPKRLLHPTAGVGLKGLRYSVGGRPHVDRSLLFPFMIRDRRR
jgi:hypothetical protein